MIGLKGGTENVAQVPGNGPDMKKALAGTRAFFQSNAVGAFYCPMVVYPNRHSIHAPAAFLTYKEPHNLKRPTPPNTTGSPGPRRPDPTLQEVLDIACRLEARKRNNLSRLSSAHRLRKWGT